MRLSHTHRDSQTAPSGYDFAKELFELYGISVSTGSAGETVTIFSGDDSPNFVSSIEPDYQMSDLYQFDLLYDCTFNSDGPRFC